MLFRKRMIQRKNSLAAHKIVPAFLPIPFHLLTEWGGGGVIDLKCSSSTLSLFSPLFIWLCPFFTLLFLYDPFSSSPPFLPSLLLLLLIGPLILSPTYSVSYSVLFSSFLLSFSYLFRLCFLSPPSFSSPFFIYLFLLSVSPSHSLYSFSLPFFFLSPSLLVVSLVR